jgi:DNA-binding IclR family transcriptional regulator
LPDDDVTALYPTGDDMPSLTPNTLRDPQLLLEELQVTRERGYATETEESSIGLGCVAAPIYDSAGLVAAMSISVPCARLPEQRREELLPHLRSAARDLSLRLGASEYPDRIAPGETRTL